MPIELGNNSPAGAPVLHHQQIGEMAAIAIVRTEQRQRLRRNQVTGAMEPIPNGTDRFGNPKVKQELVIHGLAMPGTTMVAKLGEHAEVPAPGAKVRLILKAKGFGEWIEAVRKHRNGKLNVGDVLCIQTTHAQQYDEAGNPKGNKITDQAAADATPRGVTLGFYGTLALSEATDPSWINAAEDAYRADELAMREQNAIPVSAGFTAVDDFAPQQPAPVAAPPAYAPPQPAYQQPPAPVAPAYAPPQPAYQQPPAPVAPAYAPPMAPPPARPAYPHQPGA